MDDLTMMNRHIPAAQHLIPRHAMCNCASLVVLASTLFITAGGIGTAQDFQPGELPLHELPDERAYDFTFTDIDVGKILERVRKIRINLPLDVKGIVSGWLWVQRSADGWFDFKGYRVEGKLTCPQLNVEGWLFNDAVVRFGYGNSEWRIGNLRGDVGHAGQTSSLGTVELMFTLPLEEKPATDATAEQLRRATTEATLNAAFKNADLGAVLNSLNITFSVENSPANLAVTGSVATGHLRQLEDWDFNATFESEWLQLLKNRLHNLQISARVTNGAANLQARAYASEGELHADVDWPQLLGPAKGIGTAVNYWPQRTSLRLGGIRLGALVIGSGFPTLSGTVEGDWQFTRVRENDTWQWSTVGHVDVEELVVDALRLGNLKVAGEKEQARQQFEGQFEVERDEGRLQADLTADLAAGADPLETELNSYSVQGQLENFLLQSSDFVELPQNLSVRANGSFQSRGSPSNWIEFAELDLSESPLQYGAKSTTVQQVLVQVTPEQFRLPRFQVTSDGQRVLGSAIVRRNTEGEHEANLLIDSVAIGPWVEHYAPPPLKSLEGEANLQLHLKKDADVSNWFAGWSGNFGGNVTDMRWQGMTAGQLQFQGILTPQQINVSGSGSLFGGAFSVSTEIEPGSHADQTEQDATPPGHEKLTTKSQVTVKDVDVGQLIRVLQNSERQLPYAGVLDLDGQLSTRGEEITEATLNVAIPWLTYKRLPLLRQLQADLAWQDQTVEIYALRGEVAGGRVNVRGGARVTERSLFAVDVRRLELRRLIALFDPAVAEQLDGRISFRGSLTTYPDRSLVTASGAGSIDDAEIYGVPLQRAGGTTSASYDLSSGNFGVRSRDLHGKALGGSLRGQAELRGGSRYRLQSNFSVANGELEDLSQSLGFGGIVGQGRFDATASLESSDLMALNQLGGRVVFDFESGSARSVPLLGDVVKFLPFGQLQSTSISGGMLRAQFGQGQARVEDFEVFSAAFFFTASGRIGLASGSLDLNALLQTGGGWQQQIGSQTLLLLAPEIVPQIALITEAAELIRNRTLYVHIAGTTSHPVLQPRIIGTLSRAYVQNLARSLIGVSIPAAAATSQQ